MLHAPTVSNDEQMTVSHAARLLGVSEQLVRVLANSGRLPCQRISGMRIFTKRDVLELLDQRMSEAR